MEETCAGGLQTCPQTGAVAIDVCNKNYVSRLIWSKMCTMCLRRGLSFDISAFSSAFSSESLACTTLPTYIVVHIIYIQ